MYTCIQHLDVMFYNCLHYHLYFTLYILYITPGEYYWTYYYVMLCCGKAVLFTLFGFIV